MFTLENGSLTESLAGMDADVYEWRIRREIVLLNPDAYARMVAQARELARRIGWFVSEHEDNNHQELVVWVQRKPSTTSGPTLRELQSTIRH